MNILLTSVGQRAYMVNYFKEALNGNGEVHAATSAPLTAAYCYADKYVVSPRSYESNYIDFIFDYCKTNKIDAVIPFMDIDLPPLAAAKQRFADAGISIIISSPEFIKSCNDKWFTYKFLVENGFNTPKTFLSIEDTIKAISAGELNYPIMVKARFGAGSMALCIANNEEELHSAYEKSLSEVNKTHIRHASDLKDVILFQEKLSGKEYAVDVINDLNGNFKTAIIKEKVATHPGETDIITVVDCPAIYETSSKLGRISGHIGNVDCDYFLIDGVPYVLELNARFGGCYPFSHAAGCNLPLAIVKWLSGEDVPDELLQADIGATCIKHLTVSQIKNNK